MKPLSLKTLRRSLALALLLGTTAISAVSGSDASAPAAKPAAKTVKRSDELPLLIQVRSEVDRPFEGWRKAKLKEHGKLYAIIAISEAPSDLKLVQPVDEDNLLRILRVELTKRGFVEITPKQQPEIVLTVTYGRGLLRNPYQDDSMVNDSSDPPVVTITGAFPTQLIRQKEKDFEEKLQNANFEKLFIRVTAWKFPEKVPGVDPGKKIKPYQLWKTIIITDDPTNRDLNQFLEKMLAAGANFFDREIEKEEAEIVDTLPEGKVTVGDIKVLEDGAPDIKTDGKSDRKTK